MTDTVSIQDGRLCPDCQTVKPVLEYYVHSHTGKPYKRCKTCHVAFMREWRQKRGGKEVLSAYYRKKWAADPDHWWRTQIRQLTDKAIRKGYLRPGACSVVDGKPCDGEIEAHHDDYGRPLEVRWVCRRHHRQLDGHKVGRKRREEAA